MALAKIEQILAALKAKMAFTGVSGTYTSVRATPKQWVNFAFADNEIIISQGKSSRIGEAADNGPQDWQTVVMLECSRSPNDTSPEAMDTLSNTMAVDIVKAVMTEYTLGGLCWLVAVESIETIDYETYNVVGCRIEIQISYRTNAVDITV